MRHSFAKEPSLEQLAAPEIALHWLRLLRTCGQSNRQALLLAIAVEVRKSLAGYPSGWQAVCRAEEQAIEYIGESIRVLPRYGIHIRCLLHGGNQVLGSFIANVIVRLFANSPWTRNTNSFVNSTGVVSRQAT